MKKTAFLLVFLLPSLSLAAPPDVAADAWYSETVSSFVEAGYLPDNTPFRPQENATRAEFIELLVRVLGGVMHRLPADKAPSFDDVGREHPAFAYIEEAAVSGWVKGVGGCLGQHPCTVKPDSTINRAEATALLLRAFNLLERQQFPSFADNASGQWYTDSIRIAASNCILKGDARTGFVRPAASLNRAEMAVMVERVLQQVEYPNCDYVRKKLTSSSSKSSTPSYSDTNRLCAAADWTCTPWQKCTERDVFQTRTCTLKTQCRSNAQTMKPSELGEPCTPVLTSDPNLKSMKSLQDSDKEMYGEMLSYAQKYDSFTQQLMQPVIEDYADLIDEQAVFIANAERRVLTVKEKEDFMALGTKRKELLDRFTKILETGKLPPLQQSNTAPSYYYVPSTPSTYDNTQYCEDVKNSLGISGGWRSSQKVKEAGRKLLDAGCISSAVACSDYQVCQ